MAGVWEGIDVLDLSWGISGPMAGMLLADNGARVTKIEPPGGDPFESFSGSKVWNRGKRRAELDLKDPADRDRFLALAAKADVVIETFSPGTADKLGIGYEALSKRNPRLVYLSITGYGSDGPDADRPAYDALVAARTGQQWESRGIVGGTIARLSGTEGMMPGLEAPDDCWVGARRPGPLFGGVPWASMATFYLASIALSAALRAREVTGKGQKVETSLLQGVLCTTIGGWQKVEKPDTPNFQTWVTDPRAPKGFFQCSDGRWTHHWVPLPSFVLGVSEGDHLEITEEVTSPKQAAMRISTAPEDMVLLHHYNELMAEAVEKFPAQDWADIAAKVGVPVQVVRSPEEALLDPLLVDDGCVTEIDDPEVGGKVREVGRVYRMEKLDWKPQGPTRPVGADTDQVKAEADAVEHSTPVKPGGAGKKLGSPLEGVVVLDLGLAVAGPFGTQMLAELGAEVIKVNTLYDNFWFQNHIAMCCNRDKRSIAINLKDAQGMEILRKLVERADVVQHNMRYDAAERLGVDYETLKEIKPDIIYCHTRGHEKGPREFLPGNDQTGAALAGTEWVEGGLDHEGARPIWPVISLGDTGNGMLSAIAIVQALYHRDRTGEGQFVDTSILYAHLLNTSTAWISADGRTKADRPSLDAMQLGWNALYRLYETSDEQWLCVAAITDEHFAALAKALGRAELASDGRFATADARHANSDALAAVIEPLLKQRTAADAFALLDGAGVPCEISDPDYCIRLFNDPEMKEKGWISSFRHPVVGQMETAGLLWDLSDTPGKLWGPALWPGQNTREILLELGYDEDGVEKLIAQGVVDDKSELLQG
jgi:crotonobetainyl-CoA:carnitine CoA-transferase CaiB-like acyl-CoA transferase